MSPLEETPVFFSHTGEGEDATDFAPRLVLRYDWSRQEFAALWASGASNPRLKIRAYGVLVFELAHGLLPERQLASPPGCRRRRRLYRYRAGAEGRISHLKRGYGLRRSRLPGHTGQQTWCGWSILVYNLDTHAHRLN
ncbi:MAG: hypothetical protein ACLP8S_23860 [Solirubrobacteraceae bacterium]